MGHYRLGFGVKLTAIEVLRLYFQHQEVVVLRELKKLFSDKGNGWTDKSSPIRSLNKVRSVLTAAKPSKEEEGSIWELFGCGALDDVNLSETISACSDQKAEYGPNYIFIGHIDTNEFGNNGRVIPLPEGIFEMDEIKQHVKDDLLKFGVTAKPQLFLLEW